MGWLPSLPLHTGRCCSPQDVGACWLWATWLGVLAMLLGLFIHTLMLSLSFCSISFPIPPASSPLLPSWPSPRPLRHATHSDKNVSNKIKSKDAIVFGITKHSDHAAPHERLFKNQSINQLMPTESSSWQHKACEKYFKGASAQLCYCVSNGSINASVVHGPFSNKEINTSYTTKVSRLLLKYMITG